MRIVSRLKRQHRPGAPEDEVRVGTIEVEPGVAPPAEAYADADSQAAAAHGNPGELATEPFGDHPFGSYRVTAVKRSSTAQEMERYGPVRLQLDPISGEALTAKINGRIGLCIHGGPTRNGRLRATNGCLRVHDSTANALAVAVEAELHAGRAVRYDCEEVL